MKCGKIVFFISIFYYAFISGCQSASNLLHTTVVHTPLDQNRQERLLSKCDFQRALTIAQENKSLFLKNAESGLIHFYRKDFQSAGHYFQNAIDIYRKEENKPLLTFSDYLIFDYAGEGYDKVFLHDYNALTYLLQGDLENARVETKNADFIQYKERRKFYERIKAFDLEKQNSAVKLILNRYEKLFFHVNSQHNPYQNPFAFYLSALLFEEEGRFDDAKIDMQNALKFYTDAFLLKEKLKRYQKRDITTVPHVEIFVDVGKSPVKTQYKEAVKVSSQKRQNIYLPSFELYLSDVSKIVVKDQNNKVVARSCVMADVKAIKINAFKRELPMMLEKIFYETAREAAGSILSEKTPFAVPFYNMIKVIYSQNSALSWMTLPERVEVLSFVPRKGDLYILEARDQENRLIDSITLVLNCPKRLKNCYKHFVIRENKFCKGRK